LIALPEMPAVFTPEEVNREMSNPVFRYTGALVVAGAVGLHGLGWAAIIVVLTAVALSAGAVLLRLRARPNASLLEAASAWSMVLHALFGAKKTRRKKQ
jgi:hypothetical protein